MSWQWELELSPPCHSELLLGQYRDCGRTPIDTPQSMNTDCL